MWRPRTDNADDPPENRWYLRSAADAAMLLGPKLAEQKTERLLLAHLDRDRCLIALCEQTGSHDAIAMAIGRIIRDSCVHDTRCMVIAHNHRGGNCFPSIADLIATRQLAYMLGFLEIALLDHLIFAGRGIISFRRLGLL
jgi:DNA repair proteins